MERVGWRDRLVEEASALTRSEGWSAVTMARLADRAGVSRQTVYNEIGGKRALAEAMVLAELDRFLAVVEAAFELHARPEREGAEADGADVVAAIREASLQVLELARANPLLHAIVGASQGAQSELLPLLTTEAAPLIDASTAVVLEQLGRFDLALPPERTAVVADMVVRLLLSHMMQPHEEPARTAEDLAWIAGLVLTTR